MSKIVVFNGSPRKNGNTAALIGAFARGAGEAGVVVLAALCIIGRSAGS